MSYNDKYPICFKSISEFSNSITHTDIIRNDVHDKEAEKTIGKLLIYDFLILPDL